MKDTREQAAVLKLKLFNGRLCGKWHKKEYDHGYVAAKSMADAVKILRDAGFKYVTPGEIRVYWSKGSWGVTMDSVTVERGVWAATNAHSSQPKVDRLL